MSKIKGVFLKKIISNDDDRGFFREIFKDNVSITKKKFKQISHSYIKKNIIKGWHLHKKQSQWNYLLKGKIKVYLYDTRIKSKTFKKHEVINIDSKENMIIYFFPPGVAHGYVTLSNENHMIYATTNIYNVSEEYKIPLNSKLIPNFFKLHKK
tara:strand:+ start:6521 stop:6979 length:459 start_codon:yes stop_codon:yes gene_type:complete